MNEYAERRRDYWIEPGVQEHTYPPNRRTQPAPLDDVQRWVTGIGGAALLAYGLRQEGMGRWALAALGSGLLYQGVSGQNLLGRVPVVQEVMQEIPVIRELAPEPTQLRVRKSLTVNRPASELYDYWRNLSNLPNFMRHVKSVQDLGDGRSHWVVNVLNNVELEWDAQITVDRPNEMIAWETLPDAMLQNRGYVKFIPTARGTEVTVSLEYDPPGAAIGRLAGGAVKFVAEQHIKEEIRAFKRIIETGHLPITEGQPAARDEAWAQNARKRAMQSEFLKDAGMNGQGWNQEARREETAMDQAAAHEPVDKAANNGTTSRAVTEGESNR